MTRDQADAGQDAGEWGTLQPRVDSQVIRACEMQRVRDSAAAILREHVERGRRGLALCAPAMGAGVSFMTATLGLAIAKAGVSVLLLDANLRSPALQDFFPPLEAGTPGLLQFLSGDLDSLADIEMTTGVPNLSAVYAGGIIQSEDYFDTGRFARLLRACMRNHTLTLVDTPPANRHAETRAIAASVGYAAIVVRRGKTLADDVNALTTDLATSRAEVIGALFNEG